SPRLADHRRAPEAVYECPRGPAVRPHWQSGRECLWRLVAFASISFARWLKGNGGFATAHLPDELPVAHVRETHVLDGTAVPLETRPAQDGQRSNDRVGGRRWHADRITEGGERHQTERHVIGDVSVLDRVRAERLRKGDETTERLGNTRTPHSLIAVEPEQ